MHVFFSPQRNDDTLDYIFEGNEVEVTYNGDLKESFDLTDMYEVEEDGLRSIKDSKILPIKPIRSVEEKDGKLWVTVLNFHGPNPPHEISWPDWIEVEDGETYPNN